VSAVAFYRGIMVPAAVWADAAAGLPRSRASDVFLLAVPGQESGWRHRAQISVGMEAGPARSFWQFERGGGVAGVLNHVASRAKARLLCDAAMVDPTPAAVWRALEGHDGLAYGFARLLAWTDAAAIPGTEAGAWEFYLRTWRPGAWTNGTQAQRASLREKWSRCWTSAQAAVV
jgi:hypothetical protein